MYRRILVPIDGSETAERGLSEAIRLAADQTATLRVVHVVTDAYVNAMLTGGVESEVLLQDIRTAAESMLQTAAQRARQANVLVQTELLEHHGVLQAEHDERLADRLGPSPGHGPSWGIVCRAEEKCSGNLSMWISLTDLN